MPLSTMVQLRRLVDEPDTSIYTDLELTERLTDASNDVNTVARDIWAEKMAAATAWVDTSEGGSSRKMDQAYQHAKEMWEHFSGLVTTAGSATRLAKIVRT